ncbi:MAG: Yip1 family protein [Chlamydiales bacterium]
MENTPEKQCNPWLSIWFQPRNTLRVMAQKRSSVVLIWLALLFGLLNGIGWIVYLYQIPEWSLQSISVMLAKILLGVVFGFINLYFSSWLFFWTGRWIQGKGSFRQVKCAVGWSYYPFIPAALLGLLSFWLVPYPRVQPIIALLFTVMAVWSFILALKLLGEAHSFSAWHALVTMMISLALLFALTLVIAGCTTLYRLFVYKVT